MTIDNLVQQIQETEPLIIVYRNADEVIVGTQDQIYRWRGIINLSPSLFAHFPLLAHIF